MKNLWILFLISPTSILSQVITGTVKDSITKENVEFATVYINGTTTGTFSDKDGNFALQLPSIIFPCQIVVSHVSYCSKVVTINENSDLYLTIPLTPKVVKLNQVTVVNGNLRKKNIKHFEKAFLGTDILGKKAILENDSVLIFDIKYHEKNIDDHRLKGKPKIFKVESTAPLKINLPLLGYDLRLDLIDFVEKYNPDLKTNLISTLGYYYFIPKEARSRKEEKKYIINRLKAYYYSPQHFTRSLYNKRLSENGYKLYEIVYSTEKQGLVYNRFIPDSCLVYVSDGAIIKGLKNHCFKIRYYCDSRGFPVNPDSTNFTVAERSEIYFLDDKCVIKKDGTRPGESIVFGLGIGSKRIGATLPNNYEPVKNK